MKSLSSRSAYATLSFALLTLIGAGCTTTDTATNTATTTTTTGTETQGASTDSASAISQPSTNSATGTTTTTTSSAYADGTYSATATYISPGGKDSLPVTLTLVDGVITEASVENGGSNPASQQWQTAFASNFKALVVGKNIDDVNLSKVAGASLTTKGFNDALAQIKAQAKG